MGRDLSTIVRDLPVQIDLEAARLGDYDRDTVVRLFREYEFRTLIERLPPMAGETAEQRTERLRSVAQSGYVPAARVAGRPEGWGPGRGSDRPTTTELQLRLDFDAVVAPSADGAPPASGAPPRPFEPTDDLPAALAAAIVDPGTHRGPVCSLYRRAGAMADRPTRGRCRRWSRTIPGHGAARRSHSPSSGRTVAPSPRRARRRRTPSATCSNGSASPSSGTRSSRSWWLASPKILRWTRPRSRSTRRSPPTS